MKSFNFNCNFGFLLEAFARREKLEMIKKNSRMGLSFFKFNVKEMKTELACAVFKTYNLYKSNLFKIKEIREKNDLLIDQIIYIVKKTTKGS